MPTRALISIALAVTLAACPARESADPSAQAASAMDATDSSSAAFLGLRTAKYTARNLGEARDWYARVLGVGPYFDEPFYVGFNVGGFELGLDPDTKGQSPGPGGTVAYWGVEKLNDLMQRLAARGVEVVSPIHDVGEGILVASIRDPFGNIVGLIENPHFGSAK